MEDEAYILDHLPGGRPDDARMRGPVSYAVGAREFALFCLVPRERVELKVGDKVYIGKDLERRQRIERVRDRVTHDELTHAAQSELPYILVEIVKENEEHFLRVFNEAGAISVRMHVLELLPGMGKRLMQAVVDERRREPFTSFAQLHERVKGLHDPIKLVVGRIEEELKDPEIKYRLFTRPPKQEGEYGHHGGYGGHGGHGGHGRGRGSR